MNKISGDVYEIHAYKEFKKLICQMYVLTNEQAQTWISDCGNSRYWKDGNSILFDIQKCEFVEYEEWLKENAPPNKDFIDGGVEVILCDAANRGLIPEGKYIFHYSW